MPWLFPTVDTWANGLNSAKAGKASRAGARAARVVRIIRMIRLIRLVKLYKYFAESRLYKGARIVPLNRDDDLDKTAPQSRVGAEMSDRTTKKVIIGILIMLICVPLFQPEEVQYINDFLMYEVMDRWTMRNFINQTNIGNSSEIASAIDAWDFAERQLIATTNCIYILYQQGKNVEKEVYVANKPDPSALRATEREIITISKASSDFYKLHGIFDTSAKAFEEAWLGVLLTTFVIALLAVGTMTFASDVNNLVIIPIERMVQLVTEISSNPLGGDLNSKIGDTENTYDGMETTVLLRTITKIAGLMRVGFGEAGAEIIGRNLNLSQSDEGGSAHSMNLLGNGRKIESIFAFCDVRNFTDTTECLQEEVMLFVNRIAHILHNHVVQCGGAANKNIGDAFLLTWKVDPSKMRTGIPEDHGYVADRALLSLIKTMVEMVRYEEFICNFSPTAVATLFERMPSYSCRIGCGLHFGWAIEGAIGSDTKIDASYISPHVNLTEFLEGATKDYGIPLLMSEPFYELLTPMAQVYCRKVDSILKSENDKISSLFTYDIKVEGVIEVKAISKDATKHGQRMSSERKIHKITAIKKSEKTAQVETRRKSHALHEHIRPSIKHRKDEILGGGAPIIEMAPFLPDVWDTDKDLVDIRCHFNGRCRRYWDRALDFYLKGDWQSARYTLCQLDQIMTVDDGPSDFLMRYMEKFAFVAPQNWQGFRDINAKIDEHLLSSTALLDIS